MFLAATSIGRRVEGSARVMGRNSGGEGVAFECVDIHSDGCPGRRVRPKR